MKARLLATLIPAAACLAASAADVTYRSHIADLVKKHCAECHGADAPSLQEFMLAQDKYREDKKGPRTATYGELVALAAWPETGALMRRLDDGANTPNRQPGNMYKHLGKTDEERKANLALVKAWVGEGAWNLKRWEKRGEVPAITKEELDRLQLRY